MFRKRSVLALVGSIMALGSTLAQDQAPRPSKEPAPGTEVNQSGDTVETIQADTSREIERRFRAENPVIREHLIGKISDVYEDGNPGLKLERVLIGSTGTLLEISGLARPGKSSSAIIRKDTFRILEAGGAIRALKFFDGVTELRDSKGGSALIVKPGDSLFVWFEPVDDYRPFSVEHHTWDYKPFVYFESIDPRFRERYDKVFVEANKPDATPEQMKDFLVGFARNDPDKRAGPIFLKLIQRMRAQNSFEGFYHAYLLLQDPKDAKAASRLVRTDEHRRMMENVAVVSLVDKSRLLELDLRLDTTATKTTEGSCWMLCRYNFKALKPLTGAMTLRANVPGAPIKLRIGTYRVTLTATATMPRSKQVRSSWVGNFDGSNDQVITKDFTFTLAPPNYSATVPLDLGTLDLAFAERGSAGGYTLIWATGNATTTANFKMMELAN